MTDLVLCRCGVHIRRGEACPFCARRGRVLAGVLGLGLAACSPPPAPVYGGPPTMPEPPPTADAGAPETAAPETAAPETAAPETSPAPIYGGPPAEPQAPETEGQ